MSSKKFLHKVQDIAVKTRIISRKQDLEDLLDDSWLYEEEQAESTGINYYDNNIGRAYENPKRETGRSARTDKRTFGYQLPLTDEEEIFERQVKRSSKPVTYRKSTAPRTQKPEVYFDIIQ